MKKKLALSVIIFVIVSLMTLCVGAATYGDLTYEVSNEEVTITDCSESATSVTIPATIDGYPVTKMAFSAFYNCTSLISVTIPDSMTSISYSAFYNCTSLTNVNIGNSVKSIDDYAFRDCTSLKSISIPDNVTSIGNSAFDNCCSLTSVNITDVAAWCSIDIFDRESNPLYYAGNLYLNGQLVTELIIPDEVTRISDDVFAGCTSLVSAVIPESVTNIKSGAFYGCSGLESISIPDSVTSIGSLAFYNTAYYNDDSNWSNGVLYIGKHLIEAQDTIDGLYTIKSGTKVISDYAFYNCTSLTHITIPDGVTGIGKYAFHTCTNLESITIPDSITYINYDAFRNTAYYKDDSNWLNGALYIGKHLIKVKTSVTGSFAVKDGTKSIADSALSSCRRITSVTMPDSLISICDDAFSNCTLTSITIPDGVTSIGSMAFSCCGFESITIHNSVRSIGGGAFFECTSLADVYYTGTQEEWKEITINSGNDSLLNANIHYEYSVRPEITVTSSSTLTGISYTVAPENVPTSSIVIVALYENDRFVGFEKAVYDGESLTIPTEKEHDFAKFTVWSTLESFTPVAEAVGVDV